MRRPEITVESVVALFEQGRSVKAIADELGISRGGVARRLRRAGVTPRDRSEAMFLRMKQSTPEQRAALAAAAHDAVRGKRRSRAEMIERARQKQVSLRYVGIGEPELAAMLRERGVETVPQFAVDRYNIDLVALPVAVEVEVCTRKAGRLHTQAKAKDLLERGWCVVIVSVRPEKRIEPAAAEYVAAFRIEPAAAEYVAAFIQRAQRDPSFRGEYRVVRGSGQVVTESRADLDKVA